MAPSQVWLASSPAIVVLPCSSRSVANMAIRAASASGAAPPNMPECIGLDRVRTVTQTLARPRRLVVRLGTPTAKLPASQTRIASAAQQVGVLGHELLQTARALLFGAFADDLDAHGQVVAQRAECGQVHGDVALAVGGPAAVPTALLLRQLPGRATPGGVVERRLDVVVKVQQHRWRSWRSRSVSTHRLAAVVRLIPSYVLKPELGERIDEEVHHLLALLGEEQPGAGSWTDRNDTILGQVGTGLRQQVADPLSQRLSGHQPPTTLENCWLSSMKLLGRSDLVGAVRLHDQEQTGGQPFVGVWTAAVSGMWMGWATPSWPAPGG